MHRFIKYPPGTYGEFEHRILDFWRQEEIFKESITQRPPEKAYAFYDGPPFITGLPHHGTLLSSIVKDVVPRFQTMKGWRVERRWGWDCHGLPAENFIEKKLGLEDKQAVLNYGLEKYIVACRENMIATGSLWEETIERIGRWVEFKGAYKTMDADYMESVWWAFKQLHEKGKIYEGEKVLMYCTRCATPVSKVEIAMDNSYQTVEDPSVYYKFKLQTADANDFLNSIFQPGESPPDTIVEEVNLLAWTTTPWTLPANTALAVNSELDYSLIAFGEDYFVLATEMISKVFVDEQDKPFNIKPLKTFKGEVLVNMSYRPIFENHGSSAHKILSAHYVSISEGTGIVHLAPAYGEEDYDLAAEAGVPIVSNIDDNGCYIEGPWRGQNVWRVNPEIAQTMLTDGKLLKMVFVTHSYPHCHRCQTRLMYKAHPSWFLDITSQKQQMLQQNQAINWFPKHIKEGRFKAIVESAPDWNISRDRLWATPLPVWRGQDPQSNEQKTIVVGSYKELEELSGQRLEDYHRPWVDDVQFEKDGVIYKRVDKVLDCWFESGSMPFAQFHYPFAKQNVFEDNFPADFIVEYVGQVRAWFYYLHILGVALFDKAAFSNVIVTGTILGNDGRKISKSLGNYTDPLELIEKYSADAYRLVLINSPVLAGEDFSLTTKDIADKQRKLGTLRNTLSFFLLYAVADEWQLDPVKHCQPPSQPTNILDKWLLIRLSQLNHSLTKNLAEYNLPAATKPLLEFIEDLSNWYVRRNRKRFWKTDNDADKQAAYHTLYFTLYHLAHLIAPLCPFIAEEIYDYLGGDKKSVHLADWPELDMADEDLIRQMKQARSYITKGLALRADQGLKVRQPLARLIISESESESLPVELESIILEELNVKALEFQSAKESKIELDVNLTDELKQEGRARELVRHVQVLRKEAGLEVENRINLSLKFDNDDFNKSFANFGQYIKNETLALNYDLGKTAPVYEQNKFVKIAGCEQLELLISLEKNS